MESKAIRVTWRASERHKFNFFVDPQRDCHCPANVASGSINAPESFFSYKLTPAGLYQVTWNMPATNRLLFEAGAGVVHGSWPTYRQPEVSVNDISIFEQTTGVRYNSGTTFNRFEQHVPRYSQRASMSYVTGSHAFKAGFQLEESLLDLGTEAGTTNVNYTFRNRIPVSVTQWATPFLEKRSQQGLGVLRPGSVDRESPDADGRPAVRVLQRVHSGQNQPMWRHTQDNVSQPNAPNGWVPERSFPEVNDAPLWKDFNPRMGAAYDLFGNGRTALKFAMGRYVAKLSVTITTANQSDQRRRSTRSTRTWNDANVAITSRTATWRTGLPTASAGAVSNQNFGGSTSPRTYADDAIRRASTTAATTGI